MAAVVDPKEEAQAYLDKHKLGTIFENLQAHILFERPANVREFMIEYLARLKKDEEGMFDKELSPKEVPQFFTEKDLKAMYGVFDVNRTGSISSTQAKEGLTNLGIEEAAWPEIPDRLSEKDFSSLAALALEKKRALA